MRKYETGMRSRRVFSPSMDFHSERFSRRWAQKVSLASVHLVQMMERSRMLKYKLYGGSADRLPRRSMRSDAASMGEERIKMVRFSTIIWMSAFS